jgi:HSP20 family protein
MAKKEISKSSDKDQSNYMTAFKNLENKIENMFQNLWNDSDELDFTFPVSLKNMPKMDVVDRDKEVFVKAELPGIEKDDLDISISNDRLVIKGNTSHEEKEEDGDYIKQEISKSEVYRSVQLPSEVDDSKAKTSFKNGVLELTIPKKKSAHRRRIEIT